MMYMRLYAVPLFLLFLISCNKDTKQDWTGMEHFDFEISGTVSDYMGNPVAGISVSAMGSETSTGSDGEYFLKGSGSTETSLFVNFSDKDGAENGGLFMGASQKVQLDYVKGRHGPYLGLFRKSGVNASLNLGLTPVPDFNDPIR